MNNKRSSVGQTTANDLKDSEILNIQGQGGGQSLPIQVYGRKGTNDIRSNIHLKN